MSVELKPAVKDELEIVWKMQVEAFSGLLEKYQDYDLSPASEKLEKVAERFEQPGSVYYFIVAEDTRVGIIRVVDKKDGSRKRISPISIMPEWLYGRLSVYTARITGVSTRYCRKKEISIYMKKWATIGPGR